VTRMQALLGDLRDVERIRTQRFVIDPRPEEVGALVDEALELQRPLAEQKHIALRLDVPAPETLVRADRDRVFQVLGNLLGNAVKFTPTGGSIDVAARPRQAEVCFAIHDSGPGIPEEHWGDVFARGWSASQAAGGGTGLGLYIAKGIVEAHGGRISAEGRPGEGTTVSFTLPIA
jgi:signal transduction histidine kinase